MAPGDYAADPVMLGPFGVFEPIGTGPDGTTWRAQRDDVPQWVTRLAPRDGEESWSRDRRLRLAGLVEHPAVLPMSVGLVSAPRHVATPPQSGRWIERFAAGRLDDEARRSALGHLAEGLVALHDMGLFLGDLGPTRICQIDGQAGPVIDPSGLDALHIERDADRATQPPEVFDGAFDDRADVFALAATLVWARRGAPIDDGPNGSAPARWRAAIEPDDPLAECLKAMLADAPEDRPDADQVALMSRLDPDTAFAPTTETAAPPVPKGNRTASLPGLPDHRLPSPLHADEESAAPAGRPDAMAETDPGDDPTPRPTGDEPQRTLPIIGRFELGRLIGEGAMGQVYESIDPADGSRVAVKIMRANLMSEDRFRKRFDKEVRLLRTVRHSRIANLVDAGIVGGGLPYLVLEFVEGRPLSDLLQQEKHLPLETSLRIAADVLRALDAVHAAGIVHRDIKPANVMVQGRGATTVAVLCDFGIARLVDADDERLTAVGALVGTPHYMSPEAARGLEVDGRADLYAVGVLLYELLTGDPPFDSANPTGLLIKHIQDPVPPLARARPDLPEPVTEYVHRLLDKDRDARPADAAGALDGVSRLLRGEPTDARVHPPLPDSEGIQNYVWSWDLSASSAALWPLVSDTRRINRALGLNPFEVEFGLDEGIAIYHAAQRLAGFEAKWDEQPMEWIEGRRIGNLRIYEKGPLRWMRAVTDLEPLPGGGTRITQTVQLKARYGVTRLVASYEAGVKTRKAYEQIFARFDKHIQAMAAGQVDGAMADPFEAPESLSASTRSAIELAHQRLRALDLDELVVDRLVRYVAEAPSPALNRIRPRALAERMQVEPQLLVEACLHGVREGLLSLLWDLLCPVCRVPSDIANTLAEIADHGHCQVCALDFELDFAGSIEMVFRPQPSIRAVDDALYCMGGPAQAPHVAVQMRLAPGERLALNLLLGDGAYRLAGRRLPYAAVFRVHAHAPRDGWDVELGPSGADGIPRSVRSGRQRIVLTNGFDHDVLLRIERLAERDDAMTAADAMGLEIFRALFPHERLAPGALVNVARVTLLRTAICEMGRIYADDGPRAFAMLHAHFERVATLVADHGGSVIKMEGEGLVCAFDEPGSAVKAGFALFERETALTLRASVNGGPAYVATLDGRLDYFGHTVHRTALLLARSHPGKLVVAEPLSLEPGVARVLAGRNTPEAIQLADGSVGLRYVGAPPVPALVAAASREEASAPSA